MASTLQALAEIQLANYGAIVVLTAIGYDYILTFSDEIEYIWNEPWTQVSALFVLTRYFGLCSVVIVALTSSSFLLVSPKGSFEGGTLQILEEWTLMIFLDAADMLAMLRVWVLYARSRFIFGALLALYAVVTTLDAISCIIFTIQNSAGSDAQGLDSFCEPVSPIWTILQDCAQIALSALMILFIIIQYIREAHQMYKTTKQIYMTSYISLLIRKGTMFFITVSTSLLIGVLVATNSVSTDGWRTLLEMMGYIPPFILVPRFVMSLRAFYARGLQGHRGNDVDTAFGLGSVSGSTIMFAEGQNEVSGEGEEIQMEEIRAGTDTETP